MKKLAIFGDSFATSQNTKLHNSESWTDLMSNYFDTTVFGLDGSSLKYSAKKFDENHLNFDIIVFVVTNPYRLDFRLNNGQEITVTSIQSCNRFQEKYPVGSDDWKDLERCKEWLLSNNPVTALEPYFHNAIIEHLRFHRKDIILIPAFENSFPNQNLNFCMRAISDLELACFNLNVDDYQNYKDLRQCHMTADNNRSFAIQLHDIIIGKRHWFNLVDFIRPKAKNFNEYFLKNTLP